MKTLGSHSQKVTAILLKRLLESEEQFRRGESYSLDEAFAIARQELKRYNKKQLVERIENSYFWS